MVKYGDDYIDKIELHFHEAWKVKTVKWSKVMQQRYKYLYFKAAINLCFYITMDHMTT